MPYKDIEQKRKYQREWVAKRRASWFKGKVCAKCGGTEHLELDHIDPTKKVSHRIWSWSWPRILEEVAKCQVLCLSCHMEKTMKERDAGLKHGLPKGYEYYGCRCVDCRAAHNKSVNEWRWKTGRRKRTLPDITDVKLDNTEPVPVQ